MKKVYGYARVSTREQNLDRQLKALAIIQDVAFKLEETPAPKLHWWNRFGIWLSKLRRK